MAHVNHICPKNVTLGGVQTACENVITKKTTGCERQLTDAVGNRVVLWLN